MKSYPSEEWTEAPCVAPADRTTMPGPQGVATPSAQVSSAASSGQVGNAVDFIATISGSTIQLVEGAFPSTQNLSFEWDKDSGTPNMYDLQANSNVFSTPACNGHANCQGWEQFEYSSVTNGGVLIEWWLLNYGSGCAALGNGWAQFNSAHCHKVSAVTKVTPVVPVTALSSTELYAVSNPPGSGNNPTDYAELYVGSTQTLYSTAVYSGTILSLYKQWSQVEFNVFGDWNYNEAMFTTGTSIEVEALVTREDDKNTAPSCVSGGTTGETNNLNLPPLSQCIAASGYPGYIEFTEHN